MVVGKKHTPRYWALTALLYLYFIPVPYKDNSKQTYLPGYQNCSLQVVQELFFCEGEGHIITSR